MPSPLLIAPAEKKKGESLITRVCVDKTDLNFLNLEIHRFKKGQNWRHLTGHHEALIVILSGQCQIASDFGHWNELGERDSVFQGLPTACYFSRDTEFNVQATSGHLEFAYCWTPTTTDYPACLIRPKSCESVLSIDGTVTRSVRHLYPESGCQHLQGWEVVTQNRHAANTSFQPMHSMFETAGHGLESVHYHRFEEIEQSSWQWIYREKEQVKEAFKIREHDMMVLPSGCQAVATVTTHPGYQLKLMASAPNQRPPLTY